MLAMLLLTLVPGQFPTVEAEEFPPELQKAALAGTVRIYNANTRANGTGAIVALQGPFMYVLTAGHVIRDGDDFVVATFAPDTYPRPKYQFREVKVMAQSQGIKDLALLRVIVGGEKLGPPLPFHPPPRDLKKAKAVLTVGCDNGQPPTCQVETVLRAGEFSREAGGAKAKCWEVARPQVPGRSGGPMLDAKGQIIGVCSGNNAGERGYFCHLQEIEAFLRANYFRFLMDEPRK